MCIVVYGETGETGRDASIRLTNGVQSRVSNVRESVSRALDARRGIRAVHHRPVA